MAEKWMQKAFAGSHGQFKAKAKKAGMSTAAYASKIAKSPSASTKSKRQANLAKIGMKYGGGAKQPHPKTNPGFYDTEPHAPANKIAGSPNVHYSGLDTPTPKMVPHSPGRFDGIGGGAPHRFKPPAGRAHGYGHLETQRAGAMRFSGSQHAHRLGKR